jgi:hypothetical protein
VDEDNVDDEDERENAKVEKEIMEVLIDILGDGKSDPPANREH